MTAHLEPEKDFINIFFECIKNSYTLNEKARYTYRNICQRYFLLFFKTLMSNYSYKNDYVKADRFDLQEKIINIYSVSVTKGFKVK